MTSRAPLREVGSTVYMPPLRSPSLSTPQRKNTGDRFIPDRSSMDFDLARSQLTESRTEKSSPAKEAYRRLLADILPNNRTRILAFKSKLPPSSDGFLSESDAAWCSSRNVIKSAKPPRYISQTSERSLRLPGLIDDYCLNLLDWGRSDLLLFALGNEVHGWNVEEQRGFKLVKIDEGIGPVTSVSWLPSGYNFAIGLNNSHIQLWDLTHLRLFKTLSEVHRSRVGSMAWNNTILTTGGMDGKIVNNDIRSPSPVIQTYRGHTQEICGLKWSGSGRQLASGGKDNLLNIWDLSMYSSAPHRNQWVHRFEDHTAAVRALAWCPFQSNLLASGGGWADRCIKFWNTHTGGCLNSVDTGSQVCSLLWNKNERELLSSHGSSQNQLTLWKYPSMVKMAELTGHSSRPLYMAQSPDGSTVASAAGGDSQSLLFWNVFGTPGVHKPAAKVASAVPFSSYNHIRGIKFTQMGIYPKQWIIILVE